MSKPYTLTISDGEHSTGIRLSAAGLDHLLSCAEIGAEGDTDEGEDRTEASHEVQEALSELRLFEKLSGEPLDPQPFLDTLDRGAAKTLAGGVSQLDDGSLRSA